MESTNELSPEMRSWFEDFKRKVSELMNNQYRVFSSKEVCAKFEITDRTLRTWNDAGLRRSKINGKVYYTWPDILHFLDQNKVK